ncbi:phosphoribosylaminoimidazolesuccinocarboxamide synthase, partial [Enterococcus faecalis]|uniref:phosphoribosylaminoimidazolesuccinocarboxamide synthase n=1 Tax=Enterococcus faecalis TaxID=1351 RepID=UPI003D6A96C2
NQITSLIFEHIQQQKIHNHFNKKVSVYEQLIQAVEMIPLEVVVRNYGAGSFSKRLAIEEGTKLVTPIIEFYYKEDRLDDP